MTVLVCLRALHIRFEHYNFVKFVVTSWQWRRACVLNCLLIYCRSTE